MAKEWSVANEGPKWSSVALMIATVYSADADSVEEAIRRGFLSATETWIAKPILPCQQLLLEKG